MLQSPTWTVCWLFSHCGWSAGLTFAAAVWKSLYVYKVWFLRVICEGICVHAGWSRCFMVDTNTCSSSDVVGRPTFHLTFMCSVPGRKTNYSTALQTQEARHTQHKASCNMQTASAQHGTAHKRHAAQGAFRSEEPLVAQLTRIWPEW